MGLCLNCALCVTVLFGVLCFMFYVSFGFCLVLFFIEVEAAVFYKDDFFLSLFLWAFVLLACKTVF